MDKKSYAVIGVGRFGAAVAEELSKVGAEVLAVDVDDERIHKIAPIVDCAAKVDVCDTEMMDSLGIANMDGVVIGMAGTLDASIMAALYAKESGVPYILAKARDVTHAKILEKIGVDKVVIPEKETGIRIARGMMSGEILDFVELSDRIRIIEIPVKKEWLDKKISQINFKKMYSAGVVAVRGEDGEVETDIDGDTAFKEGMSVYLTIDRNNIAKIINK